MAAVLEQHNDDPERSQLEALERMLAALCDEAMRIADDYRSQRSLGRETALQLMALDERRAEALEHLEAANEEPRQFRIGRLEKLIEALHCSWAYFSGARERAAGDPAVPVR